MANFGKRLPTIRRFMHSIGRRRAADQDPMLDITLLRKDLARVVARLDARASPQPLKA